MPISRPASASRGGNLERDLATVQRLSDAHGTEAGLISAWLRNSRHRRDWPLRQLHERVLSRVGEPVIGVVGVTYKENTHSIKNSPAVALIKELGSLRLRVFDPAVRAAAEWHPRMTVAEDALSPCDGADALVIMTPWPQFRALKPGDIAARLRGRVVIDPFSMLDRAADGCRRPRTCRTWSAFAGARMTLSHAHNRPRMPDRVVVLGASGFLAAALPARPRQRGSRPSGSARARSIWRTPRRGARLAERLRPRDVLVFLSALTPDKGRNSGTLMRNLAMCRAVCEATRAVEHRATRLCQFRCRLLLCARR